MMNEENVRILCALFVSIIIGLVMLIAITLVQTFEGSLAMYVAGVLTWLTSYGSLTWYKNFLQRKPHE